MHTRFPSAPDSGALQSNLFILVSKFFLPRSFKQVLNVLAMFSAAVRKHLHRDPTKSAHNVLNRPIECHGFFVSSLMNEFGLVFGVASNLFRETYCQVCKLHELTRIVQL